MDARELIDGLRGEELRSIQNDVSTGLRDHILKTLDERGRAQELIRQQYTGRYPFELLQNANDAAAERGIGGRVRFVLTSSALVIADQGSGFGSEQIKAICGLARSSKDPRKSIGYKGLGFKSVGEITYRPQISSGTVLFGFDEARARDAVEEITGPVPDHQRLPVYAFPFLLQESELGEDAAMVSDLRASGFATVFRLPLRPDVDRDIVEAHVLSTITPRLLLFLEATDALELSGTEGDFDAQVAREASGDQTETLLQVGEGTEHWIVLKRRMTNLDRQLVDPIGDAWRVVEEVGVSLAVPLDADGQPSTASAQPLHVYFPTEEITGFPFVIHGDFALELDRRHIARSPEALPYNEWLTAEAGLLAAEAAEALAKRYKGSPGVVSAFAPVTAAEGFGARVRQAALAALQSARFVPTADAQSHIAQDVVLLPASIRDPAAAHAFLRPGSDVHLVLPEIEQDAPSRSLLADLLEAPQLDVTAALDMLAEPTPDQDMHFYEFLTDWHEAEGRRFPSLLTKRPVVRIMGGAWVPPATGVFFPRQRDEIEFPPGLNVPVAVLPEVDGLRPLLEAAGVRSFEWRQLIPEFVLPLLTDEHVADETRASALQALRGYYETERTGDPRIHAQIAQVLLPAHDAANTRTAMAPAGSLYFSAAWLGHDRLEAIYGPFGTVEFLALEPPASQEQRLADLAFLKWIGINAHPRIDARVDDTFPLDNLSRHVHSRYGQYWESWRSTADVVSLRVCDRGHATGQQLRSSYGLDRFPELVESQDAQRLLLLWQELCLSWADLEPALTSEFRCNHGWHSGNTVRTGPSMLLHMIRTADWVPCVRAGKRVLVRPDRAWRISSETPPRIIERIAVLDPSLDVTRSASLVAALGVVDAARPKPHDLVMLLGELESAWQQQDEDQDRDQQLAARWAMRTLNDVLDRSPRGLDTRVPLLARLDGRVIFHEQPFVAEDALLAETWEPVIPILDADRDLRRLYQALNLRVLDEEVVVLPDPRRPRDDLQVVISQRIEEAKPYLAAVAIDQAPSRESDVVRGLSRLEIAVCEDLVLRYELDGLGRERQEAVSYIATRFEQQGIIRRRTGTAHLEIDTASLEPHWYAFGPQLAHYLGVPTQGDALALLLAGTKAERQRYLAARRIPLSLVDEVVIELAQTPDDQILQDLLRLPDEDTGALSDDATETGGAEEPVTAEDAAPSPDSIPISESAETPLPAIDHDSVEVTDAFPPTTPPAATPTKTRQPGSLGPIGPIDHEAQLRLQRRIGKRGEDAVVQAERRRQTGQGRDPDLVVWRSQVHEYAPYDVESLDDEGHRIYIEVKSTTSDDPTDAFEISEAELLFALGKRSNSFVYRVTEAHTASPKIWRYQDPIAWIVGDQARLRMSGARLAFLSEGS